MHLEVKIFQIRRQIPWFICQIKRAEIFNHPLKSQNRLPKQTQSPVEVSNSRQSPVVAKVSAHLRADVHKSNQSPLEAVTNTDLPIVEAHINTNENMLCLVRYKEFNRVYSVTKLYNKRK